jgi:hypothetical protein
MAGHSWIGIGGFLLVVGILLAAALSAWAIFALVVAAALILALAALFTARRAAVGPVEDGDIDAVSRPDAPPDASPEAPHGYTPSV